MVACLVIARAGHILHTHSEESEYHDKQVQREYKVVDCKGRCAESLNQQAKGLFRAG